MSGGGGGGGDDGVEYQRQQEEARQARIREGMARIDELFNGKQVVTGYTDPMSTLDGVGNGHFYDASGREYDLQNGNSGNLRWTGTSAPGVKGPGGRVQSKNAAGVWETLPETLYRGATKQQQGGFNDAFFDKRATAYTDFALPQVQQQYGDQQKALTFALARGGNLQSSLASDKNAELDKDFTLQRQAVYDTGRDYANQGRSDMAAQKANAISMLQASADPDAAYTVAQTSANQLSAMPAFTPLTGVVKNVAAGLGTYLNNQSTAEAIAKAQQQQQQYSLPSSWKGSGKVGG